MFLLELNNIEFSYNNSFEMKDISLQVYPSEFISILGPNGSGKSTLLKILSGLLTPSKGIRLLDGKNYSSYDHRSLARLIGYVPQSSFSVFPFSIYEIVMMGRTAYMNFFGIEKDNDIKIVNETLERLNILHIRNKGINEVSGGEAQQAFIARALVQQPKLLLLDEPNAHLDIKHQISIFNILSELNKELGLTIITVSHDINLVSNFTERIILLKDGKIFLDGNKSKVLLKKNLKSVFDINTQIIKNDNKINVFITS
ncbi:MAG: ABC transporter ATP-binding protein [Ignavibacteriales bacterium]|nr:ABC transporter ATP-binding protein [Ignavibacteriales bacterium]